MPIYEYRCAECGHEMEKLQKISDTPLVECPACGKPALQKLVSAAGFRLKGGGWYETDFKSGKKKNVAKGDSAKGDSAKAEKKSSGDKAKSSSGGDKKTG
jgi:putative FmdB family regulatory protein